MPVIGLVTEGLKSCRACCIRNLSHQFGPTDKCFYLKGRLTVTKSIGFVLVSLLFHRYKLHEDGFWRLQTVRLESMEVSQQLLGQKMPASAHGSDDDDDDDSDDGHRLAIDEGSHPIPTGKRGRAAASKRVKTKSLAKDSQPQVEIHQAHSAENNDFVNPAISNGESADRTQGIATEASREASRRGGKRKRSDSGGEGGKNSNTDPGITSEGDSKAKRGRSVAADPVAPSSPKTRSSPSKPASGRPKLKGKSLISIAAKAAGLDTLEGEKEGERHHHFSMPSVEDLSSLQAVSGIGAEDESQTHSHPLTSEDKHTGAQVRQRKCKSSSSNSPNKNVVPERPVRKTRAMPSRFSPRCLNQKQGQPHSSLSPATNSRCSISSSPSGAGRKTRADSKLAITDSDKSPATASVLSASPAWWMPPSVEGGGESGLEEGETGSAGETPHYGTDTDFSEYNPDSPGSSTSVYAINPQYIMQLRQRLQQQQDQGKQQQEQEEWQEQPQEQDQRLQQLQQDQIVEEFEQSRTESNCETLSGHLPSISQSLGNPASDKQSEIISQLHSPPYKNQPSLSNQHTSPSIVTLSSSQNGTSLCQSHPDAGALSSHENGDRMLPATESDDSVSASGLTCPITPTSAASLIHHHREDTNDSWFALLTQAELCREEQQKEGKQLPVSPGGFAEVFVASVSQLTSLESSSLSTVPATPFLSPEKASSTSTRSPPKAMFPSPEKSFFTIGWALGAGVSPVKQEWKLQAPSEDCRISQGTGSGSETRHAAVKSKLESICKEEELDRDPEQGSHGRVVDSGSCSSATGAAANMNNSNSCRVTDPSGAPINIVTCVPDSDPDTSKMDETNKSCHLQTLQTVSNISTNSTSSSCNDSEPVVEGRSVVVCGDSGMVMYGDQADPGTPQELYQIVQGPDGEYQMVGLTSADLCNFVDSEGRSIMFPHIPLNSSDISSDQTVANSTNQVSVITVDENGGWVVTHGAENTEDRKAQISETDCYKNQDGGTGTHCDTAIVKMEPASHIHPSSGQTMLDSDVTTETCEPTLVQDRDESKVERTQVEDVQLAITEEATQTLTVCLSELVNLESNDGSVLQNATMVRFDCGGNDTTTSSRKPHAVDTGMGASDDISDKVCDDKDTSDLYNLQMLGEVALSSKNPADVSQGD